MLLSVVFFWSAKSGEHREIQCHWALRSLKTTYPLQHPNLKRTAMQGYIVRAGLVPGSAHKRKNFNNQDAYVLHEVQIGGTAYLFGAVFDGCTGGKGSRTEVGAVLLSRFFRSEIPLILSAHTPIQEVPATPYQRSVGYFGAIVRSTVTGDAEEMWTFVQNHLLCTVVGFITDGATLVVFSAGDGVIVHNENVIVIEQDDKPTYLGLP